MATDHVPTEQAPEAQNSMATVPAPTAVCPADSPSSTVITEGQPSNAALQAQIRNILQQIHNLQRPPMGAWGMTVK